MNYSKIKLQKKKISLKPYVYPRCYDISEQVEKVEKEMIKKYQFQNTNIRVSRRQTMFETFRDQDELIQNKNQYSKQNKIDDEYKTTLSLYSRLNRLRSYISDRSKQASLTDRVSGETEQICLSKSLICSHNSQNSYSRLKKLYQAEIKSSAQSADRSQDFNQSNLSKSKIQDKKRASLQMVDATSFHNCSINENSPQKNKVSNDFNNQNIQTRAHSYQRAYSTKKKQISIIFRNQTQKLNFSLFTKLQQIKQKKQDKRLSFMVFEDYQQF